MASRDGTAIWPCSLREFNVDIKPEVHISEHFTCTRSCLEANYPFNPVLLTDLNLYVSCHDYTLAFHPRVRNGLLLVRYDLDTSLIWDACSQFEGRFSIVGQATRVTCH